MQAARWLSIRNRYAVTRLTQCLLQRLGMMRLDNLGVHEKGPKFDKFELRKILKICIPVACTNKIGHGRVNVNT